MFKHKRRRPHPRPLPAVSLLPSLIMKRSFPGNKTPWSRTRGVAVEVEESPPHPAATAVHLHYCKYCFPCVHGLAKREKDDESDFPFPSLWNQLLEWIRYFRIFRIFAAPQQNVDAGAELVSQHQLGWHHWICASSGLSGSFLWKCYPCRELGIGGPSSLAMERQVQSRCGCHSPCWLATFIPQNNFPLHNYILKSSHSSKILLL